MVPIGAHGGRSSGVRLVPECFGERAAHCGRQSQRREIDYCVTKLPRRIRSDDFGTVSLCRTPTREHSVDVQVSESHRQCLPVSRVSSTLARSCVSTATARKYLSVV